MTRTLMVLSLGLVCACGRSAPSTPISDAGAVAAVEAAAPKRAVPQAAFVDALAGIVTKPDASKPKKRRADKSLKGAAVTAYDFAVPGLQQALFDVYPDHKEVWRLIVDVAAADGGTPADLASPEQFGPPGAVEERLRTGPANMHFAWYEVTSGPLAGAFTHHDDGSTTFELESYGWIEMERENEIGGWLCAHDRATDVKTHAPLKLRSEAEVLAACEDVVKTKVLLSPKNADFGGILDGPKRVTTLATCQQEWVGWVDTKNAFNADVRINFTCDFDPHDGMVTVKKN